MGVRAWVERRRPRLATSRAKALVLVPAMAVLACCTTGDGGEDDLARGVSASRLAVGEPVDGFPSWAERVSQVWANRARCDPAADLAACAVCAEKACYSPVQPLVWSHDLGRASRFHSDNLSLGGCGIQHDSPCTLVTDVASQYVPGPCNGAPSCACEAGTLSCGSARTAWNVRVTRFAGSVSAENISSTGDPVMSHYMFLHEPDSSSACGFRHTNGHRYNILNGGNRAIGVGVATTGGGPLTQDFQGSGTPSGVVSGVHYPQSGSSLAFRANWYGADPTTAWVNLNGTCHVMELERGTRTNGTYLVDLTGITGCQTYYFHFSDGAAEHFYPTTGSFGVGCSFDWQASRLPPCGGCEPDCAGLECGDDGCGGTCGACSGGKSCSSGVCVCPSGTRDCSGTCVDTSTNPLNCGRCGNACAASEVCESGACRCVPSCGSRVCGDDGCGGSCGTCSGGATCDGTGSCVCPSGLVDCGGECVDTVTDRRHCGGCGLACEVGEGCVASACTSTCEPDCAGRECGDDGCGGSCGTCPAYLECDAAGACGCEAGLVDCEGECVDTGADRRHCGGCGEACEDGEACEEGACVGCEADCTGRECGDDGCGGTCGACGDHMDCSEDGLCDCWPGLALCDGACVEMTSDVDNCGGCGVVCDPFDICFLGDCLCLPYCEGRECGDAGCGESCGACDEGEVCGGGGCLCEGERSRCGEACVDLRDDPANCGGCGEACEAGEVCSAGSCGAPPEGCEPSCAGRECGGDGCGGSCGTCAADRLCADGGRCLCPGSLTDCGGECVDERASDEHCGACGASCPEGSRCVRAECTGEGRGPREIAPGPFVPAGSVPGLVGGWDCDCRAGGAAPSPTEALLAALALALALLRARRRGARDPRL